MAVLALHCRRRLVAATRRRAKNLWIVAQGPPGSAGDLWAEGDRSHGVSM